jgi:hypothetical protein
MVESYVICGIITLALELLAMITVRVRRISKRRMAKIAITSGERWLPQHFVKQLKGAELGAILQEEFGLVVEMSRKKAFISATKYALMVIAIWPMWIGYILEVLIRLSKNKR